MRRVSLFAGLVVTALCPLLVACTPAMDERAAIALVDDSVRLDVLLCAHDSIGSIRVAEVLPSSPREWSVENPQSGEWRLGGEEWFSATLLNAPPDWPLTVRTLSEFEDGVTYYLDVWTSDPPGLTMTFSLADLRDLEDDQVLAATQRGALAMTRDDFENGARAGCE